MPELDHVGIAVPSLAEALALWRPLVGEPRSAPEEVPSNRVRVVFLTVGTTHLELLEPTDPSSPVGRFLAGRGPGVHHIAFHVPSVDRALAEVAARGGQLVDRVARPGARGRRVGFAHPSAFGGVLVEFVEGP
jgi:methylmalonyl-CoA epimerase